MASNSQLTEEERNFIRFFFLNFKVSPDIVRRFFDGVFPPAQLAQTINSGMKKIINLKNTKRINAAQVEILRSVKGTVWPPSFPPMPVGTKPSSSKDFDLTLMICLLRNLGGLSTPSNGWDQLPLRNETSPEADLATLKWYRNMLAHTTATSININEFTDKWTQVDKALASLNKGKRPHDVTEIFNYDLDGVQAKTLAKEELKLMKKEYLECEKEKEQIESVLFICEKEKKQIESDLSHYKKGNLPINITDANASLVETWKKDDESFYDTKGSDCVYDKVKDLNCILVTSSSGLGKTATIRHIALKLQSKGFEIVPLEYPEDIIKYKTIKKQVFLIDDVLGKYDLSPTLLEQWERKNEKLISCLGTELGSHKILCTLRSQIALNKRFKNASTILNKEVIDFEHESYTLSKGEKQQLLMKHLTTNNLEEEIKTEDVEIMCETNYAFPLLCKLVANDKERFRKRIDFFRQPIALFRDELDKLSNENVKLYCILVICMLYKGSFSRRMFDNDHDEKINRIMQACGLQTNMSMKELEDSAVSAVGSYFTEDRNNFRFIHDALEETVGYHFYKFNPRVMLTYCDIFFIRDRIRMSSNENQKENVEENIVIIREDELHEDHLHQLYIRLWKELIDGRFSCLLMSNILKNERFVCMFGSQSENKNNNAVFNTISSERTEYSNQSVFHKILKNLSNDELRDKKDAISRVMISLPFRSTLMHWIVAFGCYELFNYAWSKMNASNRNSILGRDYIFIPSVKSFFPLAVLGGSLDIVTKLISSGADVNCFSEFWETPLYLAVKSDRYELATLLVRNGAQVNRRGWFAMKIPIAVTSNKQEFISLVLEHDLNQTDLHEAVRHNALENIKSNIRSKNIDSKTKSGWTALHYAVLSNNLEAVKVLFHDELSQSHFSNVDLTHDEQRKVLYRAPTPEVNIADNNGLTAVHLAVINDNIEILSLLLRYKAEVKVCDVFDRTPLHYTTSDSATNVLLTHISRNKCSKTNRSAENEKESRNTTMSALMTMFLNISLQSSFRNMFREYVNMPDKDGNTPLHSVIHRRQESSQCVEALLDNRANPHLLNDSGSSALDLIKNTGDTAKYINASAQYRKSIEKTYKIFALVMIFLMAVTFVLSIYLIHGSVKKSQRVYCVGQGAYYDNILLVQVMRSTHFISLTIVLPWLLSLTFYIRNSYCYHRCQLLVLALMWSLIICIFFISVGIFVYILPIENIMGAMLLVVVLCLNILVGMHILDRLILRLLLDLPAFANKTKNFEHGLMFCVVITMFFVYVLVFQRFYSISDINTLHIKCSNYTEFRFVNISCTNLVNNISYTQDVDFFSAQCLTDPHIASYIVTHGTLTVESGFIDWSEIGRMCLFCLNLSLYTSCVYCLASCCKRSYSLVSLILICYIYFLFFILTLFTNSYLIYSWYL